MPYLPLSVREKIEDDLRSYVGSLNWLGTCTHPDISTITNIISRYLHKATPSHISAAKYDIKYLKGTLSYGIQFTSKHNISLEAFVKFPTNHSKVLTFTDATGDRKMLVFQNLQTIQHISIYLNHAPSPVI